MLPRSLPQAGQKGFPLGEGLAASVHVYLSLRWEGPRSAGLSFDQGVSHSHHTRGVHLCVF